MSDPYGYGERLGPTLGNPAWMRAHQQALMAALPSDWTSAVDSHFQLRFGLLIKIEGVEWRTQADLVVALWWLTELGWCEARKDPHGASKGPRSLIIRRRQQVAA